MTADAFTTTPSADVLLEQLSLLVEQFNAATAAEERIELHLAIVRLRDLLQRGAT